MHHVHSLEVLDEAAETALKESAGLQGQHVLVHLVVQFPVVNVRQVSIEAFPVREVLGLLELERFRHLLLEPRGVDAVILPLGCAGSLKVIRCKQFQQVEGVVHHEEVALGLGVRSLVVLVIHRLRCQANQELFDQETHENVHFTGIIPYVGIPRHGAPFAHGLVSRHEGRYHSYRVYDVRAHSRHAGVDRPVPRSVERIELYGPREVLEGL